MDYRANNQLDPGGRREAIIFRRNGFFPPLSFPLPVCLVCFLLYFLLVCNFKKKVREAKIIYLKGGSDWDVHQMRELLYQYRSAHCHVDLRK